MPRFIVLLKEWRYLLLLCALLMLVVVHPVLASFFKMESLFDASFALVFMMLVFAMVQDKVWRLIACILCMPAVMLLVGGHLLPTSAQIASETAGLAFGALFFVTVAGKILRTIFTSRDLTLDSVFGAICGYLLLGVSWAFLYAMIYTVDPESFEFGETIQKQIVTEIYRRNLFIYYSFVTLTTVGYGDLTPLSIATRNLSWVEAMTGQLYLAVLIAGLMSAFVARNMARVRDSVNH